MIVIPLLLSAPPPPPFFLSPEVIRFPPPSSCFTSAHVPRQCIAPLSRPPPASSVLHLSPLHLPLTPPLSSTPAQGMWTAARCLVRSSPPAGCPACLSSPCPSRTPACCRPSPCTPACEPASGSPTGRCPSCPLRGSSGWRATGKRVAGV